MKGQFYRAYPHNWKKFWSEVTTPNKEIFYTNVFPRLNFEIQPSSWHGLNPLDCGNT
jgi:hypothetical protein